MYKISHSYKGQNTSIFVKGYITKHTGRKEGASALVRRILSKFTPQASQVGLFLKRAKMLKMKLCIRRNLICIVEESLNHGTRWMFYLQ
jgi:hypothetical protein